MTGSKKQGGFLLPDPVTGYTTICALLQIPDNPAYIAAFKGHLAQLGRWHIWDKTYTPDDTRASEAAQLWRTLLAETLVIGDCATMGVTNLRVQDCELQAQFTGSEEWIVIGTFADCADTRAQQLIDSLIADGTLIGVQGIQDLIADGTLIGSPQQAPEPRPQEGTCKDFYITLDGNGKWLCPVPIYAGDSIEVIAVSGGWGDGGGDWRCPDGRKYLLGECLGAEIFIGTDPKPSIPHMVLIGHDGSTYWDMRQGTVHTPTLTVQAFALQANDATIADNWGSVNVHVRVCANTYAGDCAPANRYLTWAETEYCYTGNQTPAQLWHDTGIGGSVQFNPPPTPGFPRAFVIDLRTLDGFWPNKSGPWEVKINGSTDLELRAEVQKGVPGNCNTGEVIIQVRPLDANTWYTIPADKPYMIIRSGEDGMGQINTICIK